MEECVRGAEGGDGVAANRHKHSILRCTMQDAYRGKGRRVQNERSAANGKATAGAAGAGQDPGRMVAGREAGGVRGPR